MQEADIIQASKMFHVPGPNLANEQQVFLAEGDSWFTMGSKRLNRVSNLLLESRFTTSTTIITSAKPGDTLQHMVDRVHDPYFDRLLRDPRHSRWWTAVLISAGGNDLIDALQVTPRDEHGNPRPLQHRLLLTAGEAQSTQPDRTGLDRHVSEPGWDALAGYLRSNLRILIERKAEGPSRRRPLLLHTYVPPTVRVEQGGSQEKRWAFPAMAAFGIPATDAQGLCDLLFERLRTLLLACDEGSGSPYALATVRVFDFSKHAALDPGDPKDAGNGGDWVNEIHPNIQGYRKLAAVWRPWIEKMGAVRP